MTIIKQGVIPGNRVWRGICFNCSSEMEVLEKELKVSVDMREHDEFSHAKCPVCGGNFIMYPYKENSK